MIDTIEEHTFVFDQDIMKDTFDVFDIFAEFDHQKLKDMEINNQVAFSEKYGVLCIIQNKHAYFVNTDFIIEKICETNKDMFDQSLIGKNSISKSKYTEDLQQVFIDENKNEFFFVTKSQIIRVQIKDLSQDTIKIEKVVDYQDKLYQAVFFNEVSYLLNDKQELCILDKDNKKKIEKIQQICYNVAQECVYCLQGEKIIKLNNKNLETEEIGNFQQQNDEILLFGSQQNFIFILYQDGEEIFLFVFNIDEKKQEIRDDLISLDTFFLDEEDAVKKTQFYYTYQKEHQLIVLGSNKSTDFNIIKLDQNTFSLVKDEKQLPAIANFQEEPSYLRYIFLIPVKFTKQKDKLKTNNDKKDDEGNLIQIHAPQLLISIDRFSRFSVWSLEEYEQKFKYQKMNEVNYTNPLTFKTQDLNLQEVKTQNNQQINPFGGKQQETQQNSEQKNSFFQFDSQKINMFKKDQNNQNSFGFGTDNKNGGNIFGKTQTDNKPFFNFLGNKDDKDNNNSLFGQTQQGNKNEQQQNTQNTFFSGIKTNIFQNVDNQSKQEKNPSQKTGISFQPFQNSQNNSKSKTTITTSAFGTGLGFFGDKNKTETQNKVDNPDKSNGQQQTLSFNNIFKQQNNDQGNQSSLFNNIQKNNDSKSVFGSNQNQNEKPKESKWGNKQQIQKQDDIIKKEDIQNNIKEEKSNIDDNFDNMFEDQSFMNNLENLLGGQEKEKKNIDAKNTGNQEQQNQNQQNPTENDTDKKLQQIHTQQLQKPTQQNQQQEQKTIPKKQREKVKFSNFSELLDTINQRINKSEKKQKNLKQMLRLSKNEQEDLDNIKPKIINLQNLDEEFQTDQNTLNYINNNVTNYILMSRSKKFQQNPQNQEIRKLNQDCSDLEKQMSVVYRYLKDSNQMVSDLQIKKQAITTQIPQQYAVYTNPQVIQFSGRFKRKNQARNIFSKNQEPFLEKRRSYIDFDINKMQTNQKQQSDEQKQNDMIKKKIQGYWYQLKKDVNDHYKQAYKQDKEKDSSIISIDISRIVQPKNLIDFSKINNDTEDNYWTGKYLNQQQQLEAYILKNSELQDLQFNSQKIKLFSEEQKPTKVDKQKTQKFENLPSQKNQGIFGENMQHKKSQNEYEKKDTFDFSKKSKEKSIQDKKSEFFSSAKQSKEKQKQVNNLFAGNNKGSMFQNHNKQDTNNKQEKQGNAFLSGIFGTSDKQKTEDQKQPTTSEGFGFQKNTLFNQNQSKDKTDTKNDDSQKQNSFFGGNNFKGMGLFGQTQNDSKQKLTDQDSKEKTNKGNLIFEAEKKDDQKQNSFFQLGKQNKETEKQENEIKQDQKIQNNQKIQNSLESNKLEQDDQNKERLFTFSESQNNTLKQTVPELPQNMDQIFKTKKIQQQIIDQKEEEKNQQQDQQGQDLGMSKSQQIDPNNLLSQSDISKVQGNQNQNEEHQGFKGLKVNKIQSINQFQSPEKQQNILGIETKQVNSIETQKQPQNDKIAPLNQMQDSFAQINSQQQKDQTTFQFNQGLQSQQNTQQSQNDQANQKDNNQQPKSTFFQNTQKNENNQQQSGGLFNNTQQNQNTQQQSNFMLNFQNNNTQQNQAFQPPQNDIGSSFGQNSFSFNNNNKVNKQLNTVSSGFFGNQNQQQSMFAKTSPPGQNLNSNFQGSQNNSLFGNQQNNDQKNSLFNSNNQSFGNNQQSMNSNQQNSTQNNFSFGNSNNFNQNQKQPQNSIFGQNNQQMSFGLNPNSFMQTNSQAPQFGNSNQMTFQPQKGGLFGARK